jgi:hypothetical protein
MSPFIKWLAAVHAARWRLAHDAIGRGAVYQSRFKSVPVQTGQQLLAVWRYVERNPLRADLVKRGRTLAVVKSRSLDDWRTVQSLSGRHRWQRRRIGLNV